MPEKSGLDVALAIDGRAHIVFVTAYDQYALQAFDAAYYVGGHDSTVATRAEFARYTDKMRQAAKLVGAFGADEGKVFAVAEAETGQPPDEDAAYFLRALIAGLAP